MLEKLWNDIRLIYDDFNYNGKTLVDDLMIVSQDNHYLLYYKPDGSVVGEFVRIEKNLSLVRMWSDDNEVDITYYNIHVEVGDQVELNENHKIELTYKIITPFLRECKLKEIGI